MRIVITKRGQNRIASNREYLEGNFYPEYGRWFEDKVVQTIRRLSDNPEMGREAFPEIERPEIRKILCDHYSYWIYYRLHLPRTFNLPSLRRFIHLKTR